MPGFPALGCSVTPFTAATRRCASCSKPRQTICALRSRQREIDDGRFRTHTAEDFAAGLATVNGNVCPRAKDRKGRGFMTGREFVCFVCNRPLGIIGC